MDGVSGTYDGKGELVENRPLGRLKHRWENNIEIYLQVIVQRHEMGSSGLKDTKLL